ncbi:hypothetical protein CDO51_02720 [Natranaerobius trueperi]|uniref:Uncharacterized protein n=1 Tax=Natranaerobius trueperi TaxID=759412 RepID=A0A226BZR4_9FIRM|nr:hypothetical protein CDO51_02720 [Natranaerobius trueperi]
MVIILFIIAIKGLFNLERFKHTNKLLIIIGAFLLISVMGSSIDIIRTSYYWVRANPLSSVDLEKANTEKRIDEKEVTLTLNLELIDYGTSKQEFKIRMYFPEEWQVFFEKEYYDLERPPYFTYGHRNVNDIQEEISLKLAEGISVDDLVENSSDQMTFKYKLYDDESEVLIKDYSLEDFALTLW